MLSVEINGCLVCIILNCLAGNLVWERAGKKYALRFNSGEFFLVSIILFSFLSSIPLCISLDFLHLSIWVLICLWFFQNSIYYSDIPFLFILTHSNLFNSFGVFSPFFFILLIILLQYLSNYSFILTLDFCSFFTLAIPFIIL